MHLRRSFIVSTFALVCLAAAPASAVPGEGHDKAHHDKSHHGAKHHGKTRGGHGMHGAGPLLTISIDHLKESLGLEAAQIERIETLRAELEQATSQDREAMHALHKELAGLWNAVDLPDRTALEALRTRMHEASGRMGATTLDARLAARGVLSPEQRQTLAEVRAKHHGGDHKGKKKPCDHGGD